MATKVETIKVKWATHSDPTKVGKTEELRPQEARAAVRTGMAVFVDKNDAPPARPSMNTRAAALEKADRKDGDEAAPAPAEQPEVATDTDADGAALNAAVAATDSATSTAKASRKR